ncbi:DJ-1/PfpI family protein [Paenibacillus sp. CC-CFT747]|nr:DJ-1/PfpI family protein [Paenibacillus sp. CC-CFT747]
MTYTYVYVLDTMADWELGHVTAELGSVKRGEAFPVRTVGSSKERIVTKGGVTIVPDLTVDELAHDQAAVLLLPGADTWREVRHKPVLELTRDWLAKGITVGAICGATAALAAEGLLNDRPHTSNSLEYLKQFGGDYRGADYYRNEKIVRDGNLITTSAAGSLLLAREVLEAMEVFSEKTLAAWYDYYRTGEVTHYYLLLESIAQPDPSQDPQTG